jgi:GT2 family glycosyltransferase
MPIIKNLRSARSERSAKTITQHFFLSWLILGYRHIPLKYQTKEKIKIYFFKKFPDLKKQKSHALECPLCLLIKSIWIKSWLFFNLFNPYAFLSKFKLFLIYEAKHIALKSSTKPLVSIIIPIYGQIGFTIRCLKSISLNLPKFPFEIIVIDDASRDHSLEILKFVKGVKVFKNTTNKGFIYSCNFGAKKAKGDYVYFLNNDTQVTEGWLDHLIQTFKDFPGTGLVGSKLVYPNYKLQEAGGIIWKDGSAWNFGRNQDPNEPVFNYAREVDYCSGASIMLPKIIFNKMKGFDSYYSPAYCEDSDLALRLRDRGYRVIYQPLSTVIHYEGITSGKDTNSGIKSYQIVNLEKQYRRWKHKLSMHQKNGENTELAINRRADKKVLVIDEITPEPDRDAGSLLAFNIMLLLREMNFQVTFIARNLQYSKKYTPLLQRFGIEVIYSPYLNSIKSHLKEYGRNYNLIFLFRPDLTKEYLSLCRAYASRAKIIYHTVDLHFLRISREAILSNDKDKKAEALKMKLLEITLMRESDASIVVSKSELSTLRREKINKNLHLFSLIKDSVDVDKKFNQRQGIVFVGGFIHQPNVDAVKFFINEIMPILTLLDKNIIFYVVGSNIPKEIFDLANTKVKIIGFVEKLDPFLNMMRIMVAPLRYGAGVKGKLISAMSLGLPVVATPIAAEGMGLTHKKNILIAKTPDSFAEAILDLYKNNKLWNKISKNSKSFVDQNLGSESAYKNLSEIISKLKISVPKSKYKLSLYDENG